MLRWFAPGAREARRRAREARRLVRDAISIIESARHASSPQRLRAVAEAVRSDLARAHERGGGDPARYAPIVEHFRMLHREARRRRDDTGLTAHTLVIIYLRAEALGEPAAPAREAVDAFVAEPHEGGDLVA